MKSIFLYSAKANKANPVPPNSTLNPATSSDSPSTKSKGARFVSAKIEITQRSNNSWPTRNLINLKFRNSIKPSLPTKTTGQNKQTLKKTS